METISASTLLFVILGYFLILVITGFLTAGSGDNKAFFTANKNSHWLLVAIGMIGASLSGVTFVSIPGVIGKSSGPNINFSYMQMVLGYLAGYAVIALVLMPIYYRYHVTSIYTYLDNRLGTSAYKTGAAFFILSRVIGASFRLYLVAIILHSFVTGVMGIPFFMTVVITIALIWVYTFKGGIKTIVVTDTFQTVSMLLAVGLTIVGITKALGTDMMGMWDMISQRGYTKTFHFEGGWSDPNNFFKQFISGAFIAIVMTGLDQDMMQKNLTCRSLKDAQKNIFTFSIILVFANLLFLTLGALLYTYASIKGISIPEKTDQLYPMIALNYLPQSVGILFILGLIAAAYSSADSALTSLTTSFCIDFLGLDKKEETKKTRKTRFTVHLGFSMILLLVIVIFEAMNNDAVINKLFVAAGYTYGPILGLFAFSIFTKRKVIGKYVIPVCIAAPIISYLINSNSASLFGGFELGFLIILLNGFITFAGLYTISRPSKND